VAFPRLTIEPIDVVVSELQLRRKTSSPSVMVKGPANGCPHLDCIDVMEENHG